MIAESECWPRDPARSPLSIDDLENALKAITQQPWSISTGTGWRYLSLGRADARCSTQPDVRSAVDDGPKHANHGCLARSLISVSVAIVLDARPVQAHPQYIQQSMKKGDRDD
ncbi:MAG: hypothetical protein WCC38_18330 [Pseudonocardiaceae bacterium]